MSSWGKYKNLTTLLDNHIAIITMNRPETLNALSVEMEEELLHAFNACTENQDVRVVVITGAGRAFSSGGDVKKMESGMGLLDGKAWCELANKLITSVISIPKPVIAAVNGGAVGGGMYLALACDMVVASDNASFSNVFTQIGLIPDTGAHFILPRLIGLRKAMEMILMADRVDAVKALEMGLINRVVPHETLMSEGLEIAQKLAQGSTLAFGLSKAIMMKSFSSQLSDVLELEALIQSIAFTSEDHKERIRALFMKKKKTKT
jgi:2-(1,2-epoxy-1,2-dihydrophenyl)acetyl-CoA isomerase